MSASPVSYFPAVICHVCDSPVDALLAMHVAHDEAMDLVAAAWQRRGEGADCVVAEVDGGRAVAALRASDGRWFACNAFVDGCCTTRRDAERALEKRLKRGRSGCVGVLPWASGASLDEKKPAR